MHHLLFNLIDGIKVKKDTDSVIFWGFFATLPEQSGHISGFAGFSTVVQTALYPVQVEMYPIEKEG